MNKTTYCLAVLTPLIAVSPLCAREKKNNDACAPTPPAPCYSVEPTCSCDTYCLGPENVAGNASVRPYTCNGDFVLTIAGFYWNAHQDGLDYAVDTAATYDSSGTTNSEVNIMDGHFKRPNFKWEPGFKLGIGYNTTHDGWDVQLIWTYYRGRAHSHTEADENHTLLPLWSAYQNTIASQLSASEIESHWKLYLDLVDLELGREFWTSKYLTMRPFVGLRYAYIKQKYKLEESGDSFGLVTPAINNEIEMKNKFNSIGVRGGFDTVWHIGGGFSLFGNLALSLLYGRFQIDQDEDNRQAVSPFSSTPILDTEYGFHSTKAATDLSLGVQYQTMFCNCRYGFLIGIAWENHLFFNQNQLWRINRVAQNSFSNSGENVFNQSHGDLSTQGWTLNLRFDF